MPENSYKYFRNEKCKYFPCHKGIDSEEFNCLFCYCPLSSVINCGGRYRVTADGVKDCSLCTFPHQAANYDSVVEKVEKLLSERKFPEDGERI